MPGITVDTKSFQTQQEKKPLTDSRKIGRGFVIFSSLFSAHWDAGGSISIAAWLNKTSRLDFYP
jgi:hypothetical protein